MHGSVLLTAPSEFVEHGHVALIVLDALLVCVAVPPCDPREFLLHMCPRAPSYLWSWSPLSRAETSSSNQCIGFALADGQKDSLTAHSKRLPFPNNYIRDPPPSKCSKQVGR